MSTPVTTCADCGRPIFLRRPSSTGANRWAHQFGQAWIYTCRATHWHGRMTSADYHHPADEPQRHFRAEPAPN